MKITFIIPVYNVEIYVEQCIQSVLAAWNGEREIFLVLGNSKDGSNCICEEYEKIYTEIRVIYQNGKGLSNARNCALMQATGEYVLFVDSDDYVDSKALQLRLKMLQEMEQKPDILASDFIVINKLDEKVRESHCILSGEKIVTNMRAFQKYLHTSGGIWNVWRYIYRLDFIQRNHLRFIENTRCEDVAFTVTAFRCAKYVAFFNRPYYCYRIGREGALTTCIGFDYIKEFLNILEISSLICRTIQNVQVRKLLLRKIEREYLLSLAYISEVEEKEKTLDLFLQYGWLLGQSSKCSGWLLKKMASKRSIRWISRLLYRIKKTRRNRIGLY